VSLCPELDIASQGDTVEAAKQNLTEAVELFFEVAEPSEMKRRLRTEIFITRLEVAIGQAPRLVRAAGVSHSDRKRLRRSSSTR